MPTFPQARRGVLLGAVAFVALPVWESRAAWDGASAATGSCPLGDEGDDCRRQTLMCGSSWVYRPLPGEESLQA